MYKHTLPVPPTQILQLLLATIAADPSVFERGGLVGDHSVVCLRPSDLPSVLRLCLSFPRLERALRNPGVSFWGVGPGVIQKTFVDLKLSACACCQRLTLIRGSSHKQESADGLSLL